MSLRFPYRPFKVPGPVISLLGRTTRPRPVISVTLLGPTTSVLTNGLLDTLSTGAIQVIPFTGYNAPAAHAIVAEFIPNPPASDTEPITGNTIYETSVEGQLPAATLRLYGEASGDFYGSKPKSTVTAVAIANPAGTPAMVQLEVTSFNDVRLGVSSPIDIAPNGQFEAFLSQIPGLGSVMGPFQGIIRVKVLSGSGVTAASFRIMLNERLDLLVTTAGPLNEDAGIAGHLIFPYMTDSTGYTTRFVLINPPGVQNSGGVLRYLATDGSALQVDTLKLGSVQIVPFAGFNTPHAHVVLNHRDSGVLTFMTSIEGQLPASMFRMYAESAGDFDAGVAGSTRSGVALANPSDAPATVRLEMRGLDGTLLGTSQPFQVPASGQISFFLNQAPGLQALPASFEGILRVTETSGQGVTAAAFRGMYNERGNVLFTTTGPLIENAGTPAQLIFPHIAEGGGYTTQFIVISGASGGANSGVLSFFTETGNPLNLTLSER